MSVSDHLESARESIARALGKTMRGDAISAASRAEKLLEPEDPTDSDVRRARNELEANRAGAVGDAKYNFDRAISDLDWYLSTGSSQEGRS